MKPVTLSRMLAMKFKEKADKLIEEKGWNQSELARRLNGIVSNSTVNAWFVKGLKPNTDALLKMSQIFDVPMDYLADDQQDLLTPRKMDEDQAFIARFILEIGTKEAIRRLTEPSETPPSPDPFRKLAEHGGLTDDAARKNKLTK